MKRPYTLFLVLMLFAVVLFACTAQPENTTATAATTPTADSLDGRAPTAVNTPAPLPSASAQPEPNTPTPIPVVQDTVTAAPAEPTATATSTATATPEPPRLNDLSPDEILLLAPEVAANISRIFANGQAWGRDPASFSVLGDSTVLNPHLLARFGRDDLNLDTFAYLQPTVNHFASWDRYGVAARNGLHAWSVFDPLWANKDWCESGEDLLSCEFRLNNPAFLLIRLGSNDAGSPTGFAYNLRQVVSHTIDHGIVPIIVTKPDRFEGDNSNNDILREIATENQIPVWDLDRVAETLPGKGLDEDLVHMKEFTGNDFADPAIFESGHGMQDLSGLVALHRLLQTVQAAPE